MTRHHTRRCWDWDESSVGPSPSWKWSRGEKSPRESCCTSRWRWWRGGEEADNHHRHTWTHYEYWAHWRLLSWWLYFKLMWTQQAEFQIIENSWQDDMVRVTDTFISVCSITDRFWSIRVCTMTEWMLLFICRKTQAHLQCVSMASICVFRCLFKKTLFAVLLCGLGPSLVCGHFLRTWWLNFITSSKCATCKYVPCGFDFYFIICSVKQQKKVHVQSELVLNDIVTLNTPNGRNGLWFINEHYSKGNISITHGYCIYYNR